MHGAGNDYVLMDARDLEEDWATLARAMCDRHMGVGADGGRAMGEVGHRYGGAYS